MKKLLSILMLSFIFLLTGCDLISNSTTKKITTASNTTLTETIATTGDVVTTTTSGTTTKTKIGLYLEERELSIYTEKTGQIRPYVRPIGVDVVFHFESRDTSIATVDDAGTVFGISEGKTSVVVTVEGYSGISKTVQITVIKLDDTSDATGDVIWDDTQANLRTGTKTLDFYNLNDTHGAIDLNGNEPGIARISTYLKNAKTKNNDGYVLTSTGDMWQGSADSNITKGALMMDWMAYLGCSAQAIGNHEFDWTIDTLTSNMEKCEFPLLACNIENTDTGDVIDWALPYTTITRSGVNIGIIGAIGEGITSSILASNVEGLTFADPEPYVKKWSSYLRKNGADIIVFLYHNSTSTVSDGLASYVDLIFGGHNHQTENNLIAGKPAIEGGSNGKFISHINLKFDFSTSRVTYGTCKWESISTNLEPDEGTLNIQNKYADEINEVKNEKVAYSSIGFTSDLLVYLLEQYMYKYYKEVIGGDKIIYKVVHNQARSGILEGIVTYGDIYKSFPFDNGLVLAKTSVSERNYYDFTTFYPDNSNEKSESEIQATSDNGYVYILTIDYLSEHETYGSYMTEVTKYFVYMRDILKMYLPIDFPLNSSDSQSLLMRYKSYNYAAY